MKRSGLFDSLHGSCSLDLGHVVFDEHVGAVAFPESLLSTQPGCVERRPACRKPSGWWGA